MTATGPVSGVSTPSLIVLPSNPGTGFSDAASPLVATVVPVVGGTAAAGDSATRQHRDAATAILLRHRSLLQWNRISTRTAMP